jgi:predicted glutamine amidotransferase
VSLENTHPFQRELWGKYWVFAHNGNLPQFRPTLDGSFVPVGNTDSEFIFCWLLQSLRQRFDDHPTARDELFEALHQLILPLSGLGIFNFLLSNGDCLFAHCSTELSYIVRRAPFKTAHLKDEDVMVDFSEVTTPNDRVAVIATLPLTDDEQWTTMTPGSLWLFHDGEVVSQRATQPSPVKSLAG